MKQKDGVFSRLIGQTHLMLSFFSGLTVEATWTNEKTDVFSSPNRTKLMVKAMNDALIAPQSQTAALNARNRVH